MTFAKKLRRLVPFWIRAEYFRLRRFLAHSGKRKTYALKARVPQALPFPVFEHMTPLFRHYPEPWFSLQHNKVHNLRQIEKKLQGLVLPPETTFSYWKTVGRPFFYKGFKKAMVLQDGKIVSARAGGLCQSSNALFWVALNLGFCIEERHRHSFDIFPDTERSIPFGSGATIFYNYRDLIFYNPFPQTFYFEVILNQDHFGLRVTADAAPACKYKIIQKNHRFVREKGTIFRQNEIWRLKFDASSGEFLSEELVLTNKSEVLYAADHLVS